MTNQEQYELICEKAEKYDRLVGVLDKIRAIVDEWQLDTWTDNLSYECMVKIAELVESQENEDKE